MSRAEMILIESYLIYSEFFSRFWTPKDRKQLVMFWRSIDYDRK